MKKNLRNRVATILALLLITFSVGFTGCVTVGNPDTKTAVEQIMAESNDPIAIAKAAQVDALYQYNNVFERYLKYQDYLIRTRPEVHNKVIDIKQKCDLILDEWEKYAALGSVPSGMPATFESYLQLVIDLLLALDQAGLEV